MIDVWKKFIGELGELLNSCYSTIYDIDVTLLFLNGSIQMFVLYGSKSIFLTSDVEDVASFTK